MLLHPSIARHDALTGLHRDHADDVEIRLAGPADAPALSRLSELDSRPADALHGDVLLAEVQGDPLAALSLEDDLLVAHPVPAHEAARAVADAARAPAPRRLTGRGRILTPSPRQTNCLPAY